MKVVRSLIIPDSSQFRRMYPVKKVRELVQTFEDGLFVVYAEVVECIESNTWWYPMCVCQRILLKRNGAYYCPHCDLSVFKAVLR
jgi:alkyl hydroperoxide reductase subunit AhpF